MGQILNHPDYRMRQILRYLKFSDTFISLLPSRKIIIKKELKPFIPLTRLPLASRLKFKRLKNSLKIIHFPPWKSKFCEKWTDIPLASFKTTGKKNLYGEFYFCSNHSPKKPCSFKFHCFLVCPQGKKRNDMQVSQSSIHSICEVFICCNLCRFVSSKLLQKVRNELTTLLQQQNTKST